MSAHESRPPDDLDDDLDAEPRLEVTPLDTSSPDILGGGTYPPARGRRRLWLSLLTAGALVVALAIVLGSVPSLRAAVIARFASPTPTQGLIPVGVQLDPVPTNCPTGNPVTIFSPDYPPGVGMEGRDIWILGFTGSTATLRPGLEPTADGFPTILQVLVGHAVTGSLTVRIYGVGTTNGDIDSTAPLMSYTIDPTLLPPAADGYRSWLLQFSLPAAGCYFLGVSGTPGTFFAAGA